MNIFKQIRSLRQLTIMLRFCYCIGAVLLLLNLSRCANSSVAPTGGVKDTIPPVLLQLNPPQRSTSFKSKELVFTFDEYVRLKDQQKEFIISPAPNKKPVLKLRKKSVVVQFQDSLAQNTTYYVDFGNSIVDLNESNPGEHLNFTFSTGNTIDTLIYAGKVVNALTLEPIAGALCFMYENNYDSIPLKEKPSALGRSDKDGAFIVKGLKNKPYKIVVVDDKNGNLQYEAGTELIAFVDNQVKPQQLGEQDSIAYNDLPSYKLFAEFSNRQTLLESKRLEKRLVQFVFSSKYPKIDTLTLGGFTDKELIKISSLRGDTMNIWLMAKDVKDSLTARLVYQKTDSTNQLSTFKQDIKLNFEAKKEKKPNNKEKTKDELLLTPQINHTSPLIVNQNLSVKVKAPLINVSNERIQLWTYDDERKNKKVSKIELKPNDKDILVYELTSDWKANTQYELFLAPGALLDCNGAMNDSILIKFETAKPDKFAVLNLNFLNVEEQYLVQILKDKQMVQSATINQNGKYTFNYLEPGKYKIKIIEDKNKNEVWDGGEYLKRIHPEKVVILLFNDGEDVLNTRANWEIDQNVDINLLFNEQ